MQAWLEVARGLTDQSIEIDQRDIGLSPNEIAQQLGAFLQLTEEQSGQISDFWNSERPEQTAPAQDHKYTTLDGTGWTEDEKAFFLKQCGPMMDAYGYPIFDLSEKTASSNPVIRLYCPVTEVSDVLTENIGPEAFSPRPGGFMLHPNPPDSLPATVLYRLLDFEGQNEFSATVELKNPQSAPVIFSISIYDQNGQRQLLEQSVEIEAGARHPWTFRFEPCEGPHQVKLQTKMVPAAQHNHGAWAIWSNARFLLSE